MANVRIVSGKCQEILLHCPYAERKKKLEANSMDATLTFVMFFLFGSVFMLAVARSGRKAPESAMGVIASGPVQSNGNIVILFFVMLAMMFVVATVV